MKRRIFVVALYTSPPNSMGGNTKIILELLRSLCAEYEIKIVTTQPQTFHLNLPDVNGLDITEVPYPYRLMSYGTHFEEIEYASNFLCKYFTDQRLGPDDLVYTASDFAPDAVAVARAKKKFSFIWLASLFLFIPPPWENLAARYSFPLIKYSIYFVYQRWIFRQILRAADLCLITNHCDQRRFPPEWRPRTLPIYGGVNVEQIEKAQSEHGGEALYDAIFCSRLHPQKGVSRLLDAWRQVCDRLPDARLGLIGNGEPSYERELREKCRRLRLEPNIVFLGYVNDVPKYHAYLSSRVLLHSTIYDNNGMVAAEALCTGLPVVMYDLENLRTVYAAGCLKAAPGDVAGYASLILKLLTSPEEYRRVKPSEQQMRELRDLWSWQSRASLFRKFLETHLPGSSS